MDDVADMDEIMPPEDYNLPEDPTPQSIDEVHSYQLDYCSTNFDIATCDRYAHFNQPFFKLILILRKLNIDILDIVSIAVVVNIVFVAYLFQILETPFQSVLRYYKIHCEPYCKKLQTSSSQLKAKISITQFKPSKTDDNQFQTTSNDSPTSASHQRTPSYSGISLCDSERGRKNSTAASQFDQTDTSPVVNEILRDIEKWAYNLMKFAISGPGKNRHRLIISDWMNALNEQAKKLANASNRSGYLISFENISEKSRTPKLTKLRAETNASGAICIIGHLEAKKLIHEVLFKPKQARPSSATTEDPSSTSKDGQISKSIVVEKLIGELILSPFYDTFGHYRITASFMGRPQVAKVSYYQENDLTKDKNENKPSVSEVINIQEITILLYQCIAAMSIEINLSSCTSLPEVVIGGSSANQSLASRVEELISSIKTETLNMTQSNSAANTDADGGTIPIPLPRVGRSGDRRLLAKVIKASLSSPIANETNCCNPYCVLEIDFPPQKHRTNTIHSTNEPFWDEHFLFDIGRRTKTLTVTVYDRDQSQDKKILGQCQINLLDCRKINMSWQSFNLENNYNQTALSQHATITLELMFVGQTTADKPPSGALASLGPGNRNSLQISLNDSDQIGNEVSPRSLNSVSFNMVPAPDPPNPGRQSAFSPTRRGRSRNKSVSPKRSERSRSRNDDSSGPAKAIKDWFSRRDRSVDASLPSGASGVDPQPPLIVRLRSKEQLNGQSPTGQPPPIPTTSSNQAGNSDTSSINSRNSFVNYDCSTLVIKSINEGKYYLIAKELAKSGKHGIKGTKLHIYNDHTFIATHFTRSETCEVCLKPISKRLGLGKQGYRCMDCGYTCHKGCHYKTELICANSKVSSMEMEFIGEAQLVFQESQNNGSRTTPPTPKNSTASAVEPELD